MEKVVISWLQESGLFAYILSIILNVFISIAGVLPSVFLTAANIASFGFTQGLIVSIAGEALGAIISFYLYRKGIGKAKFKIANKLAFKLQSANGLDLFILIIALRIFPFIPSGAVTLAGAVSNGSIFIFAAASTVGKIPALLIEAFTVKEVFQWDLKKQLVLGLLSAAVIAFILAKKRGLKSRSNG